jgi:predicted phage terminase large subunit-like protein
MQQLQSPLKKAFQKLEDTDIVSSVNPNKLDVLAAANIFHTSYHNKKYQESITGFHKKLASILEDVISGRKKRVIISAPPQHGKSQLVKYAIALAIARNPSLKIIYGSYGQSLSDEASLEIRDIVYSERFKQLFNVLPHESVGSINNWKTNSNGGLRATGVGGGLTGRSGDLVFVDDPHKDRQEANSEVFRERVKAWWKSTLTTRFQGDATSVCIIQTRWHEDDLAGWLVEQDSALSEELRENWEVINLPALAEEDDLLGRAVGESLYPEKYSKNYLLKKQAVDPLEFEALFQGNPTLQSGDLFFRADFIEYKSYEEVPGGIGYLSFDTALKDGEKNDLSAWIKALIDREENIWILDFGWGKFKSPELKALVEKIYKGVGYLSSEFQSDIVLIEDKASGIGLIQEFNIPGGNANGIPVKAINPGVQDKVLRSTILQGKVRTLKVRVPKFHPRLEAFLAFFSAFPNGKYDDPVDALTQLTNFAFMKRKSKVKKRGSTFFSNVK